MTKPDDFAVGLPARGAPSRDDHSVSRLIAILIILASSFSGCMNVPIETANPSPPEFSPIAPTLAISPEIPTFKPGQSPPASDLSAYAFSDSIDPARKYLFYLHGKVVEDQGLPAVSPFVFLGDVAAFYISKDWMQLFFLCSLSGRRDYND